MNTFLLLVTTSREFRDSDEFAGQLEDLVPAMYRVKDESVEEEPELFKSVVVLKVTPHHALGDLPKPQRKVPERFGWKTGCKDAATCPRIGWHPDCDICPRQERVAIQIREVRP